MSEQYEPPGAVKVGQRESHPVPEPEKRDVKIPPVKAKTRVLLSIVMAVITVGILCVLTYALWYTLTHNQHDLFETILGMMGTLAVMIVAAFIMVFKELFGAG